MCLIICYPLYAAYCCISIFNDSCLICREKERLKVREDAWLKVESQAKRNQVYIRGYAPALPSNVNNIGGDIISPGADGDNDIDLSYAKVDAEAREVSVNPTE